jgi:hypothetical protein
VANQILAMRTEGWPGRGHAVLAGSVPGAIGRQTGPAIQKRGPGDPEER